MIQQPSGSHLDDILVLKADNSLDLWMVMPKETHDHLISLWLWKTLKSGIRGEAGERALLHQYWTRYLT